MWAQIVHRIDTIFMINLMIYDRRRKKEKKKGGGKPGGEGEQQEDAEICLGSGNDDIYVYF
jgi:hypothetical protein